LKRLVDDTLTSHQARLRELEPRVRFLVIENLRMNQLLRELIHANHLLRASTGEQTKSSFDYQWREVPEGEAMPSNREFLEKTPEVLIERTALPREWFKGKKVLDAGCGSGRWTYGFLKLGAEVTAIDQSKGGLEAVRKLTEGLGPLTLVQQDLLRLEIPPASFDLVWCFGVAHHTANLLGAMENVMARVKPGGQLFMMLYGFPESAGAFDTMAEYEEMRQRLAHLSFPEKVDKLRKDYPPEHVHGYFDAVSPQINDLVTWEWIQAFLKARGFEEPKLTVDHHNHHFVARRAAAAPS
jgi:SAM-dependent methyltransferase